MNEDEPFIRFDWIASNAEEIGQRLGEHVLMVVASVVIGFVISFGLAMVARRYPQTYGSILGVAGT
ncbi:MAG: ABC transporter permease, partial [Candidatus Limnocylindria bacterium]